MTYTTLVSATELLALVASKQALRIFDCSFDLMKPSAGHVDYLSAHIPGAVYADLDKSLSAKHGVRAVRSKRRGNCRPDLLVLLCEVFRQRNRFRVAERSDG